MTARPIALRGWSPARIERVFVAYAGSSALQTAATLLSGLIILRWLEPAELGVWQTLLVVQSYLAITRIGIPNALNRELPFYLGRGETEMAHRFAQVTQLHALICGGVSLLAFAGIWFFAGHFGGAWQWAIPAMGVVTAASHYRTYLLATMRSTVDFSRLSYVQLANSATVFLLPVAVWLWGFRGLCVHAVVETALVTWLAHVVRPLRLAPRYNADAARMLVRTGFHLFVTNYLFTIALTFDRLILLWRGDVSLLGYYAPALAIASAMAVLPTAVGSYAYPRLSFAHGEAARPEEIWRITAQSIWLAAALGIPIALLAIFVLPAATEQFFPRYLASVPVMQIAAVSGVLMGMTAGTAVLRSLQAWKLLYAFMLTFVALRWLLPYLLSFGSNPLHGVALGSLFASAGAAIMTVVLTRRAITQLRKI